MRYKSVIIWSINPINRIMDEEWFNRFTAKCHFPLVGYFSKLGQILHDTVFHSCYILLHWITFKEYERYNSLILADRACFKLEMMMVFQNFWHFNLFEMSKFHRKLQRSFSWQPGKVINFETFVCRRIFYSERKTQLVSTYGIWHVRLNICIWLIRLK